MRLRELMRRRRREAANQGQIESEREYILTLRGLLDERISELEQIAATCAQLHDECSGARQRLSDYLLQYCAPENIYTGEAVKK